MIEIHINKTVIQFEDADMENLIMLCVPPPYQSSTIPAGDDITDVLRGFIKMAAVAPTGIGKPNVLNMILFNVFGKHAPKIGKRDDKLPWVWYAARSWIIKGLKSKRIVLYAEPNGQNTFRIVGFTAEPVQPGPAGETEEHTQPATTG